MDHADDGSVIEAAPNRGSGPAVVALTADGGETAGTLCDLLSAEGYLAVCSAAADPDIGGLVDRARRHPDHAGRTGIVAFGGAARAAWHAARDGLADCAVIYADAADAEALLREGDPGVPVTLHVGGEPSEAGRHGGDGGPAVFAYPGAADGFARPGGPVHDRYQAGIAWSRTICALKRTMGPHYDLEELWEYHVACEFRDRDADAAIATMVPAPYVNHVPTLTGGFGREMLRHFYARHFVNQVPADRRTIPISRTIGPDRIVDEKVFCFTHDCEIDWLLPGVPPTGRYVEIPLVGIVSFRGDRLVNEHIYWDQASVLVQIGLLDPDGLPVAGAEQARKLLDPSLPSNTMMPGWRYRAKSNEPT